MINEELMKKNIDELVKENEEYKKEINDLNEKKKSIKDSFRLPLKTLLLSIPNSILVNILVCIFTQRVIGFTYGYVISIPISFAILNAYLGKKLLVLDDKIDSFYDSIDDNNEEILDIQRQLDRRLSKENSKTEELKQEEVESTKKEYTSAYTYTNFNDYYEKFFNNNENIDSNKKKKVLKR